jgi:hypothetical protein
MSNRKLGLLVALRSPVALAIIKTALAEGNGSRAAATSLGVGRTTLARWGRDWPAVSTLLDRYTLDSTEAASIGGTASARKRAKK